AHSSTECTRAVCTGASPGRGAAAARARSRLGAKTGGGIGPRDDLARGPRLRPAALRTLDGGGTLGPGDAGESAGLWRGIAAAHGFPLYLGLWPHAGSGPTGTAGRA